MSNGPLRGPTWRVQRVPQQRGRARSPHQDIRSWILFHHERPDGHGYPEGRRDDVPLESAIIAVADAYDAMTSDHPYRLALASEEASEERREAGRQFHADGVRALLRAV